MTSAMRVVASIVFMVAIVVHEKVLLRADDFLLCWEFANCRWDFETCDGAGGYIEFHYHDSWCDWICHAPLTGFGGCNS